jgi:A/G-specific adenine glycosylase
VRRNSTSLASRLLDWHARCGRHDLPWQRNRSPYRVWVSEIMLQQTQVATVIPYFERFLRRFPDVSALADAGIDEVLHLWTGLGYYARARNLHRAAQLIRDQYDGTFPADFAAIMALPGIGRSTAGAILALATGARHPILDGNVRRVLSRHYAIAGAPDENATLETLWRLAEENTPSSEVAVYTQAIMDLGATLCTRAQPRCADCPIANDCRANLEGRQGELPSPRAARGRRRRRRAVMIVARHASTVLLVRRPASGIWGGLWCLPEFADRETAEDYAATWLPGAKLDHRPLVDIEHSFTHFDLVITPLMAECRDARSVGEPGALWYDTSCPARVGLPAPIRTLLETL